ncbi:nucleolar complex protein 3 homolog isoform X2 [Dysidea avara]|uniref:nucleolar complex protein 3 homolog isoform X2 n=1 Tax=Dysidea avara TaxID=196820 RepID=UPI00331CA611
MGKKFGKKVRKKRKILKSKFTSSFPITDVDDVRNVHSEEDDDSEREMCLDDAHRLSSLANTSAALLGKHDLKIDKFNEEPSKKKQKRESNEETYEAVPREARWQDEEETEYLLPIKSGHSIIHRVKTKQPTADDHESSEAFEDESMPPDTVNDGDEAETVEDLSALTTAQLFARREQKLNEKKELIGLTASKLVEDPENNINLLKTLRSLCVEREPEVCITVRKLAMVSTMAVFKDIVPGYRIRQLSEEDKKVKVSKEVRKLRDFEQTLLTNYTHYLTILEETIHRIGNFKNSKKKKLSLEYLCDGQSLPETSLRSLATVATKSICELMTSLTHFNYKNNIFTVVVSLLSTPGVDDELLVMACDAVQTVFQKDLVGEASLELTKLIAQTIKAKKYRVNSLLLDTFLCLNLHDVSVSTEEDGATKRKDKSVMSKKEKKRMKSVVKLQRELKEAEAVESKEKKTKLQTDSLKLVFSTYFHILKHSTTSRLISSVLEGLSKFSHLINVDFFVDLLNVMETSITTGSFSQRQSLKCILTAFDILSGQGKALNIDPRKFYIHFYAVLLQLDTSMNDEDILLTLKCIDKMLLKRKQVSLQRVLSYMKRIATVSLHVAPAASVSLMSTMKQLFNSYPRTERLLDSESASLGVFKSDVTDPELSQADSAVLWELPLLAKHYDPLVRRYASHLSLGAPVQGKGTLHSSHARSSPEEFIQAHSLSSMDCFTELSPTQQIQSKQGSSHNSAIDEVLSEYEEALNKSADIAEKQLKHLNYT